MEPVADDLEGIIMAKAKLFWPVAIDCMTFLSDMRFGPPRQEMEVDGIVIGTVSLEYENDVGRELTITLTPASIKYDKDDAIGVLISKDRADEYTPMLCVDDYILEHDKTITESFPHIPRGGDYATSVRNILGIYARCLQGDLRGVLLGKEWIDGYDIFFS
jgi:hypothetical protein